MEADNGIFKIDFDIYTTVNFIRNVVLHNSLCFQAQT